MMTQPSMPATITLIARSHHDGVSRQCELVAEQGIFAGSSSNCGLQIPGDNVADIHARFDYEDGALFIQNWMSADGVEVNGTTIDTRTEVKRGDTIRIGPHEITIGVDASSSANVESNEADEPEATIERFDGTGAEQTPPPVVDNDAFQDVGGEQDVTALPEYDAEASLDFAEGLLADFDDDFGFDEAEACDPETVALMRAEIEQLQSELAQRDAQSNTVESFITHDCDTDEQTEQMQHRMQELVDEANRSDERVSILEELLHTSEAANRYEQDERQQLESWVGDIEQRLSQREAEQTAELDELRRQLDEANQQTEQLQKKIQHAAFAGAAPKHYEETLENLQAQNRQLQANLTETEKELHSATQQLEQQGNQHEGELREERAAIAKERAQVSRMRFELSQQLSDIEELPKPENPADKETAHRIQTLRQHLREIHEQEKQEQADAPLTARLAKLWRRVEY